MFFLSLENWNPDDLRAEDLIFGTLVAFHSAAENPANQVSGYVAIVDFKNLYFRQFREFINWVLFVADNVKVKTLFFILFRHDLIALIKL